MIDTRNKIIQHLYNHIKKPIIPNSNTQNRPPYPFADYSITTLIPFDGEGNYSQEDLAIDIKATVELEPKISFSFNAYGKTEIESYGLVKQLWDYFYHVGVRELSLAGVAVVDVYQIENRTMLEVSKYEHRHGFDVIVRFKETIERVDPEIIDWTINHIMKEMK